MFLRLIVISFKIYKSLIDKLVEEKIIDGNNLLTDFCGVLFNLYE